MTRIRENGAASGVGLLATYAYDDLGRRISLTRGNGTTATYGYDGASRLAQLAENMAGATHDLTLGFAYSPASQIVLNTRSNDLYRYNGQAIGTTTSTVNGLNQVTTSGGATLAYDGRGNMTNDGSKSYGYSLENMLVSAPGGVTLAYDPALRLYQVAGATTTRLLYDGPDMIAEYDGSNALQRRYVHGPGADEPIVWYEGTGTGDRRFLHVDERGSIVAISNGSGTVTNVNAYDEYGRPGHGQRRPVPVHGPEVDRGDRALRLQGSHVPSRPGPVHADRSDRLRLGHEPLRLCAQRSGQLCRPVGALHRHRQEHGGEFLRRSGRYSGRHRDRP